jgi:hypothetical protein
MTHSLWENTNLYDSRFLVLRNQGGGVRKKWVIFQVPKEKNCQLHPINGETILQNKWEISLLSGDKILKESAVSGPLLKEQLQQVSHVGGL